MNLPDRILFVGAHCDDIELISGGLLARACFSGRTVGVLVFSDHRGVVDEALADQAAVEFRENMIWLGGESGVDIVNHSGRMLPACQGVFESHRGEIYAAMERLRNDYEMVVTHAPEDTNQDHRQVALEAARVFKAHCTLLGGEFPNNDIGTFRADLYVSLELRAIEAKTRMIANYRSQRFGGRPYLEADVVRSMALLRGSQIRSSAAEAFMVSGRAIIR